MEAKMLEIETFVTEYRLAPFTYHKQGTLTLIVKSNDYEEIEELQ